MVNPAGSIADLERPNGTRGGRTDGKKDSDFLSKAEIKTYQAPGKYWSLEMRIPKSELPEASPAGMLANFGRHRSLVGSKPATDLYVWSPIANGFGDIDRFGTLNLTGTSRKNIPAVRDPVTKKIIRKSHYAEGQYFTSFAGFVPAHAPRLVMVITVDNPNDEITLYDVPVVLSGESFLHDRGLMLST